jgi:hypothetical protein
MEHIFFSSSPLIGCQQLFKKKKIEKKKKRKKKGKVKNIHAPKKKKNN